MIYLTYIRLELLYELYTQQKYMPRVLKKDEEKIPSPSPLVKMKREMKKMSYEYENTHRGIKI
jgi:hypothetical protein